MEKKANDIDEFSFINQKSDVVSMKFLGEKQQQAKKNLKFANQIIINNNDSIAKHMTGYAKEKARLQMIIQSLQEENARLSCQVALIEGAKSQGDRDKIFKEFEADFNNKAFRLEQRKKKLIELDKLVHSFRCIEQEEEELSKLQNSSIKSNVDEPILFPHKKKLNQSSSPLKNKREVTFFDDSDDESDEGISKSNLISLQQRANSTFSSYRKKKTVKPRKAKKYLVVPPPQSLIITNVNPSPHNKSSYPLSATISETSAYAFQQQQQNQPTTMTTTTTTAIKSGQQHKTVQFTPQPQKQNPSKLLKNVQKIIETDALYHQNLNSRRNIPSSIPISKISAPLLNSSNYDHKTKGASNSKASPVIIDRAELVNEHERLVAISLNLERVMLVKKMQLRLCHDHRDLCSLRLMFDSLEGGECSNTTEKQISRKYKNKIRNLKNQIQREKMRLITVMQKKTKEEQAAISIQNLMRGFLCRIRLKGTRIIVNADDSIPSDIVSK